MTPIRVVFIAGLMVLFGSSAFAFEQTQIGGNSNAATTAAPAIAQPSGVPGVALAPPTTTDKKSTGTELRIPGLGVIGTLPKLDFGLELLYSNDRDKPTEDEPGLSNDGLTIHGSVKHRF